MEYVKTLKFILFLSRWSKKEQCIKNRGWRGKMKKLIDIVARVVCVDHQNFGMIEFIGASFP